jgi:hypothetical protein
MRQWLLGPLSAVLTLQLSCGRRVLCRWESFMRASSSSRAPDRFGGLLRGNIFQRRALLLTPVTDQISELN